MPTQDPTSARDKLGPDEIDLASRTILGDKRPIIDPSWQWFLHHPSLSETQELYRQQAASAFPCAVWIVALTAFSGVPRSKADEALRVIEAIDNAEQLLPALSDFLQLKKGIIRSSRRLPIDAVRGIQCWKSAWRVVRCLTLLGPLSDWMDGNWRLVQRWFPMLDVIADRTCVTRREILNEAHQFYDLAAEPATASRANAVWAARNLIRFGGDVALYARLQDRANRRVEEPKFLCELDCGWQVESLDSEDDLVWEGLRMRHCVGGYADVLASNEKQFFSLCSPLRDERVTVSVEPPLCSDHPPSSVFIEIAGFANTPVSIEALSALVDLLKHQHGTDLKVAFSYRDGWE